MSVFIWSCFVSGVCLFTTVNAAEENGQFFSSLCSAHLT